MGKEPVISFKSFYKAMKAFALKPRLSLKMLAQLPAALDGFNYSEGWRPSAASNTLSSLPGLKEADRLSNPLRAYYESHKEGKGLWKWDHYFDIYHRHFKKYMGLETRIVEIGIYGGGSLEMWREYFGPKCRVYGVDIEETCKAYESENISIFIGDQADRKFWKSFKEKVPAIDILIDDGGHQTKQQIATLEEMLPYLSPGGVYLCEDIHGTNNDFVSYLQGLVNRLNERTPSLEPWHYPPQFQGWIESIHFYPYVTVIEKAVKPKEKLIAMRSGTEWHPFL